MDVEQWNEINLRPVGFVRSPVTGVAHTEWQDVVSEIHLREEFGGGLLGVDECPAITVVFYLHRARFEASRDMVRHPRDRADLPLRGVFATRSQYRPNPIGVTDVEVLGVNANVIAVRGLDALDGTPVLDIKAGMRLEDHPRAEDSR